MDAFWALGTFRVPDTERFSPETVARVLRLLSPAEVCEYFEAALATPEGRAAPAVAARAVLAALYGKDDVVRAVLATRPDPAATYDCGFERRPWSCYFLASDYEEVRGRTAHQVAVEQKRADDLLAEMRPDGGAGKKDHSGV